MKQSLIGAICVIFGAILLAPAISQLAFHYLPGVHTVIILYADGGTVDTFMVELIISVVGAVLVIAGATMLIKKIN